MIKAESMLLGAVVGQLAHLFELWNSDNKEAADQLRETWKAVEFERSELERTAADRERELIKKVEQLTYDVDSLKDKVFRLSKAVGETDSRTPRSLWDLFR